MSRKTRKRRPRQAHTEETVEEKAEAAYRQSRRRFRRNDFDGAFQAIREVLELAPAYPNGQNFAGWILLNLPAPTPAQLERAEAHFREAMRVNPYDAVPALNLGRALVALGREQEAIALAESLIADNRFKVDALTWLGWHWAFRKGDVDRGLELLVQATQAGPWKARAWVSLGELQQQRGARSEACFAYTVALSCSDIGDVADDKALKTKLREIEKDMQRRGEKPPIVIRLMDGRIAGPELVAIERACREARYDDAVAALGNLRDYDLVDTIGIALSGARAAQAAGRFASARQLLQLAITGYEMYASSASSGAEGLARMAEVKEMRALLASWGG